MTSPKPINPDPCTDHACDGCARCRRGRCCRKDDPGRRLPELGDWSGPIYGQLGVLETDDRHVRCHACGAWFEALGGHIRRAHQLLADEYKAMFGLNAGTGLVSPAVRQRQQEIAREVFGAFWSTDTARFRTPEERSASSRQPRRLQARIDPSNRQAWSERSRRRYAAGLWRPPGFSPEAARKGAARMRELMQNPSYRAEFVAKNRAAHVTIQQSEPDPKR